MERKVWRIIELYQIWAIIGGIILLFTFSLFDVNGWMLAHIPIDPIHAAELRAKYSFTGLHRAFLLIAGFAGVTLLSLIVAYSRSLPNEDKTAAKDVEKT